MVVGFFSAHTWELVLNVLLDYLLYYTTCLKNWRGERHVRRWESWGVWAQEPRGSGDRQGTEGDKEVGRVAGCRFWGQGGFELGYRFF